MKQQLEQTIDGVPPGHLHPKVQEQLREMRRRLLKLAELVDDLGRLDERSQKVYVDENSLRKLVREASPGGADAVVERMRRLPGMNLTEGGSGMRPIPWEILTERMVSSTAAAPATRPNPYASLEEIRRAVQQEFPNIPDDAFEPEMLNRRFQAMLTTLPLAARAEPRAALPDVWDCLVRHLGLWGAILVTALAIAVIALFTWLAIVLAPISVLSETFWGVFWLFLSDIIAAATPAIYITVGIIIGCLLDLVR